MDFLTLIMAAGKGTRMKSETPKVLFKACGKCMVEWVLEASQSENKSVVIVGHKKEDVMAKLGDRAVYAVQEEQKGTGHAVFMAKEYLEQHRSGYAVILAGDMPLITKETIDKLKEVAMDNDAVVLTAKVDNPFGYGRIIKDEKGNLLAIVEQKDATEEQKLVNEINSSVYCIKIDLLLDCLDKIGCNNAAGEYYLTDCIQMLSKAGKKVTTLCVDFDECLGVNSKAQLAVASKILRQRINEKLMNEGVIMIDPDSTYIEDTVTIGTDTVIYPNNVIEGNTVIGSNCTLYQGSRILNSVIGDNVTIESSVLTDAKVGEGTTVGPFAYLRPKSNIGDHCRIGDFVEVKNSNIGDGTKVSHLTYIGDGDVGSGVNVGCGVVFVNYDGINKNRTVVEDNCFIGCNTNLISPVKVEHGAYIAAGSTVTDDVPSGALCIARERQTNKLNWKNKWKEARDK